MVYNLKESIERSQLAQKLTRRGKFQVLFVNYPQHPDIFEFVARSDNEYIRYVNVAAIPGAKISQLF